MNEALPLAQVVGDNVRRLRTDSRATTNELATQVRRIGLPWDTARVSALEKGRVSPTAQTLYAVALALGQILDRAVSIGELIRAEDTTIQLGDAAVPANQMADAFDGALTQYQLDPEVDALLSQLRETVQRTHSMSAKQAAGEAEQRVARDLEVSVDKLEATAAELWGRTFIEERDRRAGTDASPQKRGRVSRQLKAELRQAIGQRSGNN